MLDRQKLLMQLESISQDLFEQTDQQWHKAKDLWMSIENDVSLVSVLQAKKWSLLIPSWQGCLGQFFSIQKQSHPYQVLAVDGSQIYYDKHQGPACYLLNVGSIFISYGLTASTVQFFSQPSVVVAVQNVQGMQAQSVDLEREQAELSFAVKQSEKIKSENFDIPFVCMFDGTLIFFQTEGQSEQKEQIFAQYIKQLDLLWQSRTLHLGYISFPRSKELVNILKLAQANFDQRLLDELNIFSGLTDMDIARFFLHPGERSTVFASKAPVVYLYPKHLKPYFCYVHVGAEIVRLEFPEWIAQDDRLVDIICAIVLDQANKGSGYPVCLFEAHEQAVIKNYDREFFYHTIQKMARKNDTMYQISKKSLKKASVPI